MTYDPQGGEELPDGSRIQTTTAGELADWMDENLSRECHSPYTEKECPEGCSYRLRTDGYKEHTHWRCDDHGHTWVYFPELGQVDWFDLSSPSRLIYPIYSPQRPRRRKR